MELIPDATIIVNESRNICLVNKLAEEPFGYSGDNSPPPSDSFILEMVLVNTFADSGMNFNLHVGAQWRRLTNSTKWVPGGLHQKFESHPNSGLIQRQDFRPH